MTAFAKCFVAGSIGGLLGATLWAAISYFANAEIGWIAWGIGFLVGFCVRFAAGETLEGFIPGTIAAGIAIVAVLVGKYAAISLAVSSASLQKVNIEFSDEEMISSFADDIVKEREAKGQKIQFPPGKTFDDATAQADYPPAIWREADQAWKKIDPLGQAKRKEEKTKEMRALMGAFQGQIQQSAFVDSFGPYDILWFILAALSAYKLGHGNMASDE